MSSWVEKVRHGDFTAIPVDVGFVSGFGLAHLIDGYAAAPTPSECVVITNRVADELRRTGQTIAPAQDLWIAFFSEHRRQRHSAFPPDGYELDELDALAQALRAALLRLSPSQKAGIMALVKPGEPT